LRQISDLDAAIMGCKKQLAVTDEKSTLWAARSFYLGKILAGRFEILGGK
jgi:hypothetical protein